MKIESLLMIALFALSSYSPAFAHGEGGGGGGGGMGGHGGTNGLDNEEKAFAVMIHDELSKDLSQYVKGLQTRHLYAKAERAPLSLLQDPELLPDLERSELIAGDCSESKKWAACAGIGERGGKIIFDVKKLARLYKGISPQERLRTLRAIALHEEYHHLRGKRGLSRSEKRAHEAEAAFVGGFVLIDTHEDRVADSSESTPADGYELTPVFFGDVAACARGVRVMSYLNQWASYRFGQITGSCMPFGEVHTTAKIAELPLDPAARKAGFVLRTRLALLPVAASIIRKGSSYGTSLTYSTSLEPFDEDEFVEWLLEDVSSGDVLFSCVDSCRWEKEFGSAVDSRRTFFGVMTFAR